jgi:hypothetical protein
MSVSPDFLVWIGDGLNGEKILCFPVIVHACGGAIF